MVSQSQGSEGSYTTGGGGRKLLPGSCLAIVVRHGWLARYRVREREREKNKKKRERERERESINRQMRRTLESWLCDSGGSLRSDRLQIIVTVVS